MASVAYRNGGEEVTPDFMNEVWSAFDDKCDRIFGGRSPIVTWNSAVLGEFPARLLGITFFFIEGACVYANNVHGFKPLSVNVTDPVTGLTVAAAGGRTYDQSAFNALASGASVVSYDTVKRIANIADIPQSSYPAGYVKRNAIGVFEHSLKVHTIRATAPGDTEERTYYLQENRDAQGNGGAALPTKKHNYARADFIIEGPVVVNAPECDDFGMIVLHNLQPRPCDVTVGNLSLSLSPFECKTLRRNKTTRLLAVSPLRYFCEFEGSDPRFYWFHPSAPSFSPAGPVRANDMPTKAASMGANNLINPAVLFWWIYYFIDQRNFAWFEQDIHELCDIYAQTPEWAQYFGDPSVHSTRLGDLIHHKGKIKIIRQHKTLKDPLDANSPLVTFDEMEFRGYATIVEDFAAKLMTVTRAADGNLQIANADPDNHVDLVGIGTNLFKNGADSPGRCWRLPTGVPLNPPRKIESAIFEAGNVPGSVSTQSSYRIRRKTVTTTPGGTVAYEDKNKIVHTSSLPARQTDVADETSLPAARILTGIDQITVGDILNLNFLGRANLPSQDFGVATYENRRLRFTPFGLVLTFDEYLSVTPELTQSLELTNFDGRAYEVDDTGRFRMKHSVKFRGHGFGWPDSGSEYSAWIPPFNGRFIYPDFVDEVSGVDGEDFSLPDHFPVESDVKALTHFEATRLGVSGSGGYFWKMGQAANTFFTTTTNLDGLLAFSLLYGQPLWYAANRSTVTSANTDANAQLGGAGGRRIIALPLAIDHFNGFAQEVNKLTVGRPLDYRALRVAYGSKTLDFNQPAGEFNNSGLIRSDGSVRNRNGEFMNGFSPALDAFGYPTTVGPAPADSFGCLLGGAGSLAEYWSHWLGSRGVAIRTQNDLPGWLEFRNAPNYTAKLRANWSIDVANFQTVPANTSSTFKTWDFIGEITLNLSRPAFESDLPGGAGLVNATYQENVGWVLGINLNNYNGVRWVKTPDVQSLVESFGFPFSLIEKVRPLKLGYLEFGPELETLGEVLSVPMGGTIVRDWGGRVGGSGFPTAVTLERMLEAYHAAPTTGSIYLGAGGAGNNYPRKVIRFSLAANADEAEWKEIISDPFTAYDFENRSEGAWNSARGLLSNHVAGTGSKTLNGVLCHITLHASAIQSGVSGSNPPSFGWSVCRHPFAELAFAPDYQTLPPWSPAPDRTLYGLPSGPGLGQGLLDENGSPISNTINFVLAARRAIGPTWAGRIATPESETARQSQDDYCALLNRERDWFAVQFAATEGYTPATQLILLPQSATYLGTATYTAREQDWWVNYPDGFFTALRGLTQGLNDTAPQAPFRNHTPGAPSSVTVARGLSIYQETCARILFNPSDVRVTLSDPVVGEPEPETPPPSTP